MSEDVRTISPLHDAARRLIDSGHVIDVRVLQAGSIVTGIVADDRDPGTRHRIYLRRPARDADASHIEAECSCTGRSPCVHALAVSIAAAEARAPAPAELRHATIAIPTHASRTDSAQCLLYLLELAPQLRVSIWVSAGTLAAEHAGSDGACPFRMRSADAGAYPRYVNAEDKDLLRSFAAQSPDGPWLLQGESGTELLHRLIATGRAFWRSLQSEPLRAGPARGADLAWRALPNGDQHLCSESALEIIASVTPAAYIDAAAGSAGTLQLPFSFEGLRRYWNQPAIPPERVTATNEQIAREAGAQFPRLQPLQLQLQSFSSLRGRLILSAGPQATLYYCYNGLPIDSRHLQSKHSTARHVAGEVVYEIPRDRIGEDALRARLDDLLPAPPGQREAWLAFLNDAAPVLQGEGWELIVEADFPYRLAQAETWYLDTAAGGQADWFSLRFGLIVEGRHVNLLPALTRYLETSMPVADDPACCQVGAAWFLRLDDGRYVPIALERLQRIAATLVELFDHGHLDAAHGLPLPASQGSRLAMLATALDDPALRSHDDSLRALIEDLENFSGISPLCAPAQFGAQLRPYQQEGLGWLQFLRRYRLGGILADDMGLGKTVQALAHLALEQAEGRLTRPSLIVAPVSVIGNWQQELRRFAPGLKPLVLHGSRRKESFPLIRQADVVITSYPLLLLDAEVLTAHKFYLLILDEAQMIKNPRAKVSQAARALASEHRLCLTGTPVENHLGELWSLFDFLQPGLLGDERYFQRHYRTPIEKNGEEPRARALSERVAPFLLRRTKDSVARELPEKMEIIEEIVLDDRQRDFYDGIRLAMHRRIREIIEKRGLARSQITVLDALLKLRQACCDPRLIDAGAARDEIPSAKLEWLRTALPELIADGRRILLFSQFTSMLQLIEEAVGALSIPYCLLTGETQQRAAEVARFQSGAVPLFLISLKAGGTGLNLTAADTVIHYDPWWNPAVEAQATDRAHRIGQDKPVFVYKLIAQATVEERMLQLQSAKSALVSQLYAANLSPRTLSAQDLEALFA